MRFDQLPREIWIPIIILLIFATQEIGFFGIVMLLLLLSFLRNASESSYTRQSRPSRSYDEEMLPRSAAETPRRPPSQEQVHRHALDAVRAAGRDPESLPVLPVDIGVLSFQGDNEPVIHREWSVYDDVDYIQPFVQLRLPQMATGRVRFEIIDADGERAFVHEDDYHLVRGRNLVIPATRLPVHDQQAMQGQWELRVYADNMLLASHEFEWQQTEVEPRSALREHILEDGEISSELRAALAENRLQRMSLDELLAAQEEEGTVEDEEIQPGAQGRSQRTTR
jgi:hypothetical protein